jgi:hypothetical protein
MTFTELWTYRFVDRALPDVTDFDVEAMDGHIGKVDEATRDLNSGLVVDTGWWIFGKKRMIPASLIDRVDVEGKKLYLQLSKDRVKDAPDFDEVQRDQEDYRKRLGDYYSRQ